MADGMPSEREYRAGRSDSTASASSTGSAASPSSTQREMHLPPPIASKVPAWPGRHANEQQQQGPHRRSSHTLFEGLAAQKRKDDPASVARRQSMNEQRPPAGFFGQMWDNWVRGNK